MSLAARHGLNVMRTPARGGGAGQGGPAGAELWWTEYGAGEPLVLLHGGLVDARFFARNVAALAERFRVYTPDARGHGHTPDVPGPFTAELLLQDAIGFLTRVVGGPAHLAGHSMGGSTALLVALRQPALVRRLVLVSASIRRSGQSAGPALRTDLGALVRFLGPGYGEVSPDGAAHFPVIAGKVVRMLSGEPPLTPADLSGIRSRTLVMAGDADAVSLEDTVTLYNGIPDAELAVVPGTSHFLLQEKPALCNTIMMDFLTGEPVPSMAPAQRRGTSALR